MLFRSYAIATLLQQYGRFSPRSEVVDGRLFSWNQLAACIVWIGVIWTAIAGAIAAIVFHRRELARVQV